MKLSYLWAKAIKKMHGKATKNVILGEDAKVEAGSHLVNVVMGKYSFCGYECAIYNCDIGKFCSIASYVRIGGSEHPFEWVSTSPVFYKGRDSVKKKYVEYERKEDLHTHIGNDVWIGEGCHIKAGVNIGDGAIVGMGSVVTKDVAPYTIVAGNPAKVIRYRFDNKVCEQLLELQWWDWDEELLERLSPYIREPHKFVDAYRKVWKENNG